MVNGAGLAMATMDIISWRWRAGKLLDVGGGASQERVEAAFRFCWPTKTSSSLINFRASFAATWSRAGSWQRQKRVFRFRCSAIEGTNVEEGQRVIRDSGLNLLWLRNEGRSGEVVALAA